jgi:hypothetical protein
MGAPKDMGGDGNKDAAKRPETKEGGREEENRSRISTKPKKAGSLRSKTLIRTCQGDVPSFEAPWPLKFPGRVAVRQ